MLLEEAKPGIDEKVWDTTDLVEVALFHREHSKKLVLHEQHGSLLDLFYADIVCDLGSRKAYYWIYFSRCSG